MAFPREKTLEAAQKYVDKKKYDKALIELKKVVAADPNDIRTLQRISDLQLKMSLYKEAIDTLDSVGKAYADGGFANKAIAVYRQMREIISKSAPELADRYGHLVLKLADLHQTVGAVSEARISLEEAGTQLQRQNKDREALDVFQRIASLDAQNPVAQLRVAEGLARIRDIDGAVAAWRNAVTILLQVERRDDAIHVLERLLQHKPDPGEARRCAELYLARGHANDATHALTKLQICFQTDPKDPDTLMLVARAFDGIGQAQKAFEVRKELAKVARDTGRTDLFNQVLQYLLQVAPNDPGVRELMG